jgi:hypothetical protein
MFTGEPRQEDIWMVKLARDGESIMEKMLWRIWQRKSR